MRFKSHLRCSFTRHLLHAGPSMTSHRWWKTVNLDWLSNSQWFSASLSHTYSCFFVPPQVLTVAFRSPKDPEIHLQSGAVRRDETLDPFGSHWILLDHIGSGVAGLWPWMCVCNVTHCVVVYVCAFIGAGTSMAPSHAPLPLQILEFGTNWPRIHTNVQLLLCLKLVRLLILSGLDFPQWRQQLHQYCVPGVVLKSLVSDHTFSNVKALVGSLVGNRKCARAALMKTLWAFYVRHSDPMKTAFKFITYMCNMSETCVK